MTDKEMVDILNIKYLQDAPDELTDELMMQKTVCNGEHVTIGYALYLKKRINELIELVDDLRVEA